MWIIRSSLTWSRPHASLLICFMFPGQISAGTTKTSISFIRLGVSHCSMTWWVKQKGKERKKRWLLRWKIRRKVLKVSGGEGAGGRDEKEWHAGRRKEERYNKNERALLLLIIGGVMCQHSLRGFPPEGMIPWGLGQWNHITSHPLHMHQPISSACWWWRSRGAGQLSALFSPFSWKHTPVELDVKHRWRVFCTRNNSVWDLICGHWQKLQITIIFV